VRRIAIAAFAGLLAAGCGSTKQSSPPTSVAATTGSATLPQSSACSWQQEAGVLADFGQFTSVDAANSEIARAGSAGFKGLVVEQRGCNHYAVVLRGLTSVAQGRSLQREGRGVGFHVTLECRSLPLQGVVVAVFGRRPTQAAANRFAAAAVKKGFKGAQVVQDRCADWAVVLYGLKTASERQAFAREARAAGFPVTFERG
jgi:hypothetical protein